MPITTQLTPSHNQSRYHFDPTEVADITNLEHWNGSKHYWHYFSVVDRKISKSFGFFYTPEEAEALLLQLESGKPNNDLSLNLGLLATSSLDLNTCNPYWVNAHKQRIATLEGVKS